MIPELEQKSKDQADLINHSKRELAALEGN